VTRRVRPALALLAATVLAGAAALTAGSGPAGAAVTSGGDGAAPTKVLIVLFDQMRPEYADRFDMPNFRMLRAAGTNFRDAYLGYMGSETVIAHNVLMSGQQPRHMGWVDEAYRDTGNLLGGGTNQMWTTGELGYGQFGTLIQNEGYPKLADYLQLAQPGKKFIVVGEKSYAVESAAAESAVDTFHGDIAVRFGSRSANDPTNPCQIALGGRYRGPSGVNVPTYLSQPFCGRFYVNSDSGNTYGTGAAFPSWIYPLDGNRFVPGYDSAHLGGDTWVADAAMAMMEQEDWSGMFVTMGGIDKAGHMWGAETDVQSAPGSPDYQTHVQANAENADVQLGRMLDKLAELGQLDDTLVVLTADHGATGSGSAAAGYPGFYGKRGSGSSTSDTNWYYGPDSMPTVYNNPSPALAPLIATNNVQFSYQSTSIQTWLKDSSPAKRAEALAAMRGLPGVIATYWRDGGRYVLADTNPMSKSENKWWKKTAQSIVDTMAADNGPDIVGLLKDDVGYGAVGDHGGASEAVQRVPMVFWSPTMAFENNTNRKFQTPDVMPTILRAMGIPLTYPVDGRGVPLG
jgi:predicted AlkP superfamily pyrophosphatase or phosphodiesterase